MGILKEKDRDSVTEIFKSLRDEVTLAMFTQEMECPHCEMTRTLLEEVAGLSEKTVLRIYDFVKDRAQAEQYGVDKIPATILLGDRDYGVRFFGVPAGYEFNVLVQDILDIGKRSPGLKKDIMDDLAAVTKPVRLEVLTSPT